MVGPVLNAKKALTKESSIITAIVVLRLCSWLSLLTIYELNEVTTPTTNTKWVNTDYWSMGNNRVKFLQASGHFFFFFFGQPKCYFYYINLFANILVKQASLINVENIPYIPFPV